MGLRVRLGFSSRSTRAAGLPGCKEAQRKRQFSSIARRIDAVGVVAVDEVKILLAVWAQVDVDRLRVLGSPEGNMDGGCLAVG